MQLSVAVLDSRVNAGDFNGDGRDDMGNCWRNIDGTVTNWLGQTTGGFYGNGANGLHQCRQGSWNVVGTGDFNGDGRDDLLWRDANGTGRPNGSARSTAASAATELRTPGRHPDSWHVNGTGDFNGDGRGDILLAANARPGHQLARPGQRGLLPTTTPITISYGIPRAGTSPAPATSTATGATNPVAQRQRHVTDGSASPTAASPTMAR